MTRVAVNHNTGWILPETLPGRALTPGRGPMSPPSFDQHLEQAWRGSATPASSAAPLSSNRPQPPSTTPPRSPSSSPPRSPTGPASQAPPTRDASSETHESRDAASRQPSDPNPDAPSNSSDPARPENCHRDEKEQDSDDSADPAGSAVAATSAGSMTISGEPNGTPPPVVDARECVNAVDAGFEVEKLNQAAVEKKQASVGKKPHPDATLQQKPEPAVESRSAGSDSEVPDAANQGEKGDLPVESSDNAEVSASDGRDGEKPLRVVDDGRTSLSSAQAEASSNEPVATEIQAAAVATIDSAPRPTPPDPAAKDAPDRPGKNNVQGIEGRRAAKPGSLATPGSVQPRTVGENAGAQPTMPSGEPAAAPMGVEAAQGEGEAAGGEAKADRPTDAKTADAASPRSGSTQAVESAERRGEPGNSVDESERARFVQRVAKAFESAADRGGHVRLRLHPPELGSLRLELTVRNGQMHARLETETEAARNLLLDNLPELKERLAGHQIRVERFDVEWRGQTHGGLPRGFGDPGRWQGPPTGRVGRGPEAVSANPAAHPVENVARKPSAQTSFDVVI